MDEKKERVVAVSGYFDPIHVGHIELIRKAKELGDKLLVIVNNTEQAHLKKGFEFMPLKERMEIVKSLKFVDEVVASVDEDKSQCKSLAKFRPDVFANGGDRHQGEVPETKICNELGIEMVDGLGEKIQSSSDLVAKSKELENGIK
jgi:cytidyltransferase-like protein